MRVALISCVKSKRKGCHRAKDLYTSPLFRFAWAYASHHFDKVYILSAKHGLLDPNQRIRSYDITLTSMLITERKHWARRVASELQRLVTDDTEIHLLCGQKYREFLPPLLPQLKFIAPLEGLGIGYQLQWYKAKL